MFKRIIGLALAVVVGWLIWELFQRRSRSQRHMPQFASPYSAGTAMFTPAEPVAPEEIEAALETTPIVREIDLAELAFVASAVGVDLGKHSGETTEAPRAPAAEPSTGEPITGYCMHCQAQRTISDPHEETAKDGRRMARGTCPVCGSKIVRFLKEARDER